MWIDRFGHREVQVVRDRLKHSDVVCRQWLNTWRHEINESGPTTERVRVDQTIRDRK